MEDVTRIRRWSRDLTIGACLAASVVSLAASGGSAAAGGTGRDGQALTVAPGPPVKGPGAAYQLSTERMPDGRIVILRWNPCQTITYKVNVAALPASLRRAVLAEVQGAFARLRAASGLTFSYRGTTGEVPRSRTLDRQSAEIIVAVTDRRHTDFPLGQQILGYGGRSWYWWWRTSSGRTTYGAAITRGFVVLDRSGMTRLRAGFGRGANRGNLMLHELGHTVGLDHAGSRGVLMFPQLTAAAPNGYASGDRAGLVRLGRPAGCVSIPVRLPAPDLR